jgi:serine phosphatase RsbU (regulator of sigma subunit)
VLLVVGDIAGHGLDAVTGMVAVRNSLRGLAITGAGPATLLDWLNSAAAHVTDGVLGTVVCGIYDPAGRSLRWARAGHLPPVLVREGRAEQLPLPEGLLLGADPDASYTEELTSLRLGDTLLLFTDGLIERRDEPIDDALRALLQAASRPVGDIGGYADHLLGEAASNTGDDACLVAVRVR